MIPFQLSQSTIDAINTARANQPTLSSTDRSLNAAAYQAIYSNLLQQNALGNTIAPEVMYWFQHASEVHQQQTIPTAAGTFIWAYTKAAAVSEGVTLTDNDLQAASDAIALSVFQTLFDSGFSFDSTNGSDDNFSIAGIINKDAKAGIDRLRLDHPSLDFAIWGGTLFARTNLGNATYFSDFAVDLTPGSRDAIAILNGFAGAIAASAQAGSVIRLQGIDNVGNLDFSALNACLTNVQRAILDVSSTVIQSPIGFQLALSAAGVYIYDNANALLTKLSSDANVNGQTQIFFRDTNSIINLRQRTESGSGILELPDGTLISGLASTFNLKIDGIIAGAGYTSKLAMLDYLTKLGSSADTLEEIAALHLEQLDPASGLTLLRQSASYIPASGTARVEYDLQGGNGPIVDLFTHAAIGSINGQQNATVYNSATNAYVIVPAYNLLEVVLTTIDDGTVNFTHTNLSGIDELGVHFGSHAVFTADQLNAIAHFGYLNGTVHVATGGTVSLLGKVLNYDFAGVFVADSQDGTTLIGDNALVTLKASLFGEDTLIAGNAGAYLYAGYGKNTIYGGDGADSITIHAGLLAEGSIINGGAGNDNITSNAAAGDVIDISRAAISNVENVMVAGGVVKLKQSQLDGFSAVSAGTVTAAEAGTYDLSGKSTANLTGSDGNDRLIGVIGTVRGGAGNDTIVYSNTLSTIDGGAGSDTLEVNTSATTAVNLQSGTFTSVLANFGTGLISGVENIDGAGSTGALALTGDANINTITGGAGNDVIDGGGGADILDGGSGTDTLIVHGNNQNGFLTTHNFEILKADGNVSGLSFTGISTLSTPTGATLSAAQLDGFSTISSGSIIYAAEGGIYNLSGKGNANGEFHATASTGTTVIADNADNQTIYASANGNDTINAGNGNGNKVNVGAGLATITMGTGNGNRVIAAAGLAAGSSITMLNTANSVLQADGDISGATLSGVNTLYSTTGVTLGTAQLASVGRIEANTTLYAATGGTYDLTGKGNTGDVLRATVSTGTTLIAGSTAGQTLVASAHGNDTLTIGNGNDDVLDASNTSGNNILTAGNGNRDILRAVNSTGNNVLTAGIGNNNIYDIRGATGTNTVNGGNGVNASFYADAGTYHLNGGTRNDTFYLGGIANSASTIVGNAGTNRIIVNDYADISGIGSISGVLTVLANHIGLRQSQIINFGTFTATGSTHRIDAMTAGTFSLVGKSVDRFDLYAMNNGGTTLIGNDVDNEILTGSALGADTLIAGNGNNVYLYGGNGGNTLTGGAGINYIYGGTGNDTITGGAAADTISGGAGNDTLTYDAIDASVDGGAGIDTLILTGSSALTADLNNTTDQISGGGLETGFENIDAFTVTAGVVLTGDANSNTLKGGSGNDTLIGGGGADSLYGNGGDDTITYDSADNIVDGGAGNDTLVLNQSVTTTVNLANFVNQIASASAVTNFENIDGTNSTSGLAITGDANANIIKGGNSSDTIIGGGGADSIYGNGGDDIITYSAAASIIDGGTGYDTLIVADGTVFDINNTSDQVSGDNGVTTGFERIIIASPGLITGDNNANIIQGTSGADTIDGLGGADSIYGNDGNDVIIYDAADIIADGGSGNDTLRLNGNSSLTANLADSNQITGNAIITGFENIDASAVTGNVSLTGDAGANILTGGGGNDILVGGAGTDSLYGGAGNDIITYDISDTLIDGGVGNDTLVITQQSPFNINLSNVGSQVFGPQIITGFENIDGSASTSALNITGDTGANVINGSSFADTIIGNGGADTVFGNGGNDTIAYSASAALIDGGSGTDKLVFTGSAPIAADLGNQTSQVSGGAIVTGFETLDAFGVTAAVSFKTGAAGGTLIAGNSNNNILDARASSGASVLSVGTGSGNTIYAGSGLNTITSGVGANNLVIANNGLVAGSSLNMSNTTTSTLQVNGDISGASITGVNTISSATGVTLTSAQLAGLKFVANNSILYAATGGTYSLNGGRGSFGNQLHATVNTGTTLIAGNAQSMSLYASASGNDTLTIGTGTNDTVYAGGGINIITMGNGTGDRVIAAQGLAAGSSVTMGNSTDSLLLADGDISGATLSGVHALGATAGATNGVKLTASQLASLATINANTILNAATGGTYNLTGKGDVGGTLRATSNAGTTLIGGADNQTLIASASGADTLIAGNGNNVTLIGGNGGNTLTGGNGVNTITGGEGNDIIVGGLAADIISAGGGNDTVTFDAIDASEDGGAGIDTLILTGANSITANLGNTSNQITGSTVVIGFENLDGSAVTASLSFTGDAGANTLIGGSGNDTLVGGGGTDSLYGNGGDDRITYNAAAGLMDGGTGNNTLVLNQVIATTIDLANAINQVAGGGAAINFGNVDGSASSAALTITGNANANSLIGGTGSDIINGGAGADTINAGDGNDTVIYDAGDISINGSLGVDTLVLNGGSSIVASLGNISSQIVGGTLVTGFENIDASVITGDSSLTGDANANTLSAGAGNDTIIGGGGADSVYGNAGNDIITYSSDASIIDGGVGNDTMLLNQALATTVALSNLLNQVSGAAIVTGFENVDGSGSAASLNITGDANANTLIGGAGNDFINGGGGADTISGGAGNDTITYGATNISIDGGSDNDTLVMNGSSAVNANLGNANQIAGSAIVTGFENIDASAVSGAVSLTGDAGANILLSGSSNDTINGGLGADTISAGGGNDTVTYDAIDASEDGGSGIDTLILNGNSSITANLGNTSNQITGSAIVTGFDNLDGSSATASLSLTGDAGANILSGGSGNDTLVGGGGADSLYGNGGDDSINYNAAANIMDGGAGNNTLVLNQTTATTVNLNNATNIVAGGGTAINFANIDGSASTAALTITGDTNANVLKGGAGDDIIIGGVGADAISGGGGNDTVIYDAGDVSIDGGLGIDTLVLNGTSSITANLANGNQVTGSAIVTGFENIDASAVTASVSLTGDAGNNILKGGSAADTISGGDGNDTVYYDALDTTVDGGLGVDTLVFGGAAAVTVTLTSTTDQVTGGGKAINFENLDASAVTANVNFTGSINANILTGGAGNDTLNGGAGADSLYGNAGNDTITYDVADNIIDGGVGIDTLVVAGSGAVSINLSNSVDQVSGDVGTTTGFEYVSATALTGNFTLTGDASANSLKGGSGANFIDGGAGNDTITGGGANDTLYGGDGNDVINGGAGIDSIYGGAGNDTITFNSAAAVLDGGDGLDTLVLTGSETLVIDLANTLNQVSSAGIVTGFETINASAYTGSFAVTGDNNANNLRGGVGSNIIYGLGGNDTITGGANNDTLYGGDGNDSINGSGGADSIYGEAGNDTITYNANAVVLDGGADIDTLTMTGSAALTIDLTSTTNQIVGSTATVLNFENISAASYTGNLTITGSAGTNTLRGGSGINTIYGGSSNDSITGGANTDSLYGGDGNDTIVGGTGADSIYGEAGNDSITYDAADIIIDGGADIDTLTITGSAALTIDLSNATNQIAGGSTVKNFENITATNYTGDLTIMGSAAGNTLRGGSGVNIIAGNASNDSIIGGVNNDILTGGLGNDSLTGGLGNDTYNFARGDGVDTIVENDATVGNRDVLAFASGVNYDQLWFKKISNNLEVSVIGSTDKITISNWFLSADRQVESIQAGGQELVNSNVINLVNAMAGMTAPTAGQTTLTAAQHTALDPVIVANWHAA